MRSVLRALDYRLAFIATGVVAALGAVVAGTVLAAAYLLAPRESSLPVDLNNTHERARMQVMSSLAMLTCIDGGSCPPDHDAAAEFRTQLAESFTYRTPNAAAQTIAKATATTDDIRAVAADFATRGRIDAESAAIVGTPTADTATSTVYTTTGSALTCTHRWSGTSLRALECTAAEAN